MTDKHTTPDDLDLYLEEATQDPAFASAYEDAADRSRLLRELVALRKGQRMSQGAVAEFMGTTQSAVSELEGGGSDPRLSTLQRYARAIGCRLHMHLLNADGEWLYTTEQTLKRWRTELALSFDLSNLDIDSTHPYDDHEIRLVWPTLGSDFADLFHHWTDASQTPAPVTLDVERPVTPPGRTQDDSGDYPALCA